MGRTPIIAGNWKMNRVPSETGTLVTQVAAAAGESAAELVVCPPFTGIAAALQAAAGTSVRVGAQDVFWRDSGAYTGEVSPAMLTDLGVTHVILGHSERRGRFGVAPEDLPPAALALFSENDRTVNLKLHAALGHGLVPIVCCGETLRERRAGRTDAVVAAQLQEGLAGLTPEHAARLVIAYEPVWAIGTGESCAAGEAQRVCALIRATVARLYGAAAAGRARIQYGGSVKPENAAELLAQPDIDGALVGGASLNGVDFAAIIAAAPVQ